MDELQTGVEPALAVLPKTPVLLPPRKAALDDPALGQDFEGVHLAPLGDPHRCVITQNLSYALRKGLAHVAVIAQQPPAGGFLWPLGTRSPPLQELPTTTDRF